ncbi:SDR family NAD(P)-dependent oxidoreductase [Candidatus Woesearchaeota archaeon]|nr:SDR family NAD(P)-dependent oxidoreductase [Candidatus Woesearchaeota archaeon]
MENKRLLVIGGTGYIGSELLNALDNSGYSITVMSRSGNKKSKIAKRLQNGDSNVKYITGDLIDCKQVTNAVSNCDCVIHLAAVVRSFDKSKYNDNVIGMRNLINAIKNSHDNGKMVKLIYFSTQNVYIKKTGHYGNSKKICDQMLQASNLDWMILRPNYVYGVDRQNDFFKLLKLIKLGIAPVIGSGSAKFEPINKKDVVEYTIGCIQKFRGGAEVDLSGKTQLSINDVIKISGRLMKKRPMIIHVPLCVLRFFKPLLPFDLDGYDAHRIHRTGAFIGRSDLKRDLKALIRLL